MDKNAIKKYAVWAREELIKRVSTKVEEYGVSKENIIGADADSLNGRLLTAVEKKQRIALIERIKIDGYEQVVEEVAYTWFNRFIALRFMEVNNYLPTHIRVFTDENNAFNPQILNEAIHLELADLDMDKVISLKQANKTDELYKYLLITQCNALSPILPKMFQRIDDYTELLFPDNVLRNGSVLEQMVSLIPEEDWTDQVQIIGWLYQYYSSVPKDKVFANLKKNIKIRKEDIPAATQLFTPDWIVRYMVENSLGRFFVDKRKTEGVYADGKGPDGMTFEESEQKRIANEKAIAEEMGWKYFLPEAGQTAKVRSQLDELQAKYASLQPEEIKCIDPCMGSGHILVYMFDVLVKIYEFHGYSTRDAVASIVKNNLYGLDIDDRAAQLAYFAVMMKARQYDRRFFSRDIQPNVYAIVESNHLDPNGIEAFVNGDAELKKNLDILIDELHDAKEYGSLLNITMVDFERLYARLDEIKYEPNLFGNLVLEQLQPFFDLAHTLAKKYDAVVTNPPYMGSSNMGAKLSEFVKKNYPDSKSDLFSVFIERGNKMVVTNGINCMVTMQSWMFLSSFEKMRTGIIQSKTITNLMHMENMVMGIAFGTAVTAFRNSHMKGYKGTYNHIKLSDIENNIPKEFPVQGNRYAQVSTDNFSKIPSSPVAYWVSEAILNSYSFGTLLGECADVKIGMGTGKNDIFVREWWEVLFGKIDFSLHSVDDLENSSGRYFPYNKGGDFRLWYGNLQEVLWFDSQGRSLMKTMSGHRENGAWNYYCHEGLTWSFISSSKFGIRFMPTGCFFDVAGSTLFSKDNNFYTLGFLSSNVCFSILSILNPTLNYQAGNIKSLPLLRARVDEVKDLVSQNISLSRTDWDSFEISWDFAIHPLVRCAAFSIEEMAEDAKHFIRDMNYIEEAFNRWSNECYLRFNQLKENEEELNRIFIDIYGLQDELTPEVEDKDVTVRKADLQRDIRSFISYAVGCMFGRYSLDEKGLAYAGGDWDASKYATFEADKDNIIPICDDEYFDDDIVGRFVEFVRTVYGEAALDENLKYIANALGGKGAPKEVIRNYFLNNFYADHCKIYQKRPIYWLFDSGKKNGFKALIYMHRYQQDTIARMRTDYVHEQQARYRTAIEDMEHRIAGASTSERVKLTKQLTKLKNQDAELRVYEEKIHHLADQMIRIDLDDGVKHNYKIFKDVLAKIK